MKILGLIQARMGSRRFPGKVLERIDGKPLIFILLQRLKSSKRVDHFVVATTVLPEDDLLVKALRGMGYHVFRGHPIDVLDRFYKAASLFDVDYVVRITADNPLTDPDFMDEAVLKAISERADYVSFVDLPLGSAVEVISFKALELAHREAKAPYQREHVTPYINENPDKFKVLFLKAGISSTFDDLRLTVDYPEDLELLKVIFMRMRGRARWGIREVVKLLEANPELSLLNKHLYQKSKFDVDERWVNYG